MSAQVRTPGPWGVLYGAIYALETRAVHGGRTCVECGHDPIECGPPVIIPVSPDLIGDIKAGHWDGCTAPLVGDMSLAAAAPKLLQALKQVVTSMQDNGYPNTHPAVREARDAIAAATGMPP